MTTLDFSRRSFIKGTGAMALGALAVGGLSGCSESGAPLSRTSDDDGAISNSPGFLRAPEPITEFAATEEYDVVVVGAGEAGLAAIHSALAAGASVGCLQKLDTVRTTGNMAAAIDLSQTDEAGINACVSFINWKSSYRSDRKLVEAWARNSQEALAWWADCAAQGGVESKPHDSVLTHNGYDIHLHANTYFHAEGGHNAAAQVIGDRLAQDGAVFHFNTPCVQLLVEEGSVVGAIGEREDGTHVLLKAAKGVILATGDYSANAEMTAYYCPDLQGFPPFIEWRDGSGMCAGMWAGAMMTPPTHTKMIHGDFAPTRLEMPFLFLDGHGRRFMDETYSRMAYLNNFHRPYLAEAGFDDCQATRFFTIVPGNWESYYNAWKANDPQEISIYNSDRKVDPSQWISGSTPEELAEAMVAYVKEGGWDIDLSADAVVESIKRYNELCAQGSDDDFGKRADYMVPIEGEVIYAVDRGCADGLSAILGGLVVNENHQCLGEDFQPLAGLFAVGNASGQFFGGVDYPMDIEGLSIGRAITSGYVCGSYVARQ